MLSRMTAAIVALTALLGMAGIAHAFDEAK